VGRGEKIKRLLLQGNGKESSDWRRGGGLSSREFGQYKSIFWRGADFRRGKRVLRGGEGCKGNMTKVGGRG